MFHKSLENGFKRLGNTKKINSLERKLIIREGELQELQSIGVALSTEKDLRTLLKIILRFAVDITGADAGTLYLVDKDPIDPAMSILKFELNYNYSVKVNEETHTIPLDKNSIAGYVALTNEILNIKNSYELDNNQEFFHSKAFDEKHHYVTKSILTFPMANRKDEVIGVIQLINKKNRLDKILKSHQDFAESVTFFNETDEQMVYSLASQAAVALENANLYESIQKLFDGFVKASVSAIESRDPTTSGHSERVAVYSENLAICLSAVNEGPYKDVSFDEDDLKVLRYASLLHDFGKVGVRENVLTKAKKLYPEEMSLFYARIFFIKRDITANALKKKIDLISQATQTELSQEFKKIDEQLEKELLRMDYYLNEIIRINEPLPIKQTDIVTLNEIKDYKYIDPQGHEKYLLTDLEFAKLSIPFGSLDEKERKDIESHVTHSYEFLKKIPWTTEMKDIPEIAYGHHEKMNGKGYPRGLQKENIPIQSRIIAIADIYDALTASDRPYKKAMPVEKAIQILIQEAIVNTLDKDLVDLFIKNKIYECSMNKSVTS